MKSDVLKRKSKSTENNSGKSQYLFKESIKAMRASGVLGSCNRKTGRLGANYQATNTQLNGRIKNKIQNQILTTRGLSKAGRNQEV